MGGLEDFAEKFNTFADNYGNKMILANVLVEIIIFVAACIVYGLSSMERDIAYKSINFEKKYYAF